MMFSWTMIDLPRFTIMTVTVKSGDRIASQRKVHHPAKVATTGRTGKTTARAPHVDSGDRAGSNGRERITGSTVLPVNVGECSWFVESTRDRRIRHRNIPKRPRRRPAPRAGPDLAAVSTSFSHSRCLVDAGIRALGLWRNKSPIL